MVRAVSFSLVELAGFPTESFNFLGPPLAAGAEEEALRLVAADASTSIGEDRPTACGELAYEADEPASRIVADRDGLRYGFTLLRPDGSLDERSVSYGVIDEDTLWLLVAAGFADGSCLAAEGPQFDPAVLDASVSVLDQVAATMGLPEDGEG